MLGFLIAACGMAAILLVGELLWRKKIMKGENARKFVHILAAAYAAFWPYFVERPYILLLSLVFVAALIAIKKLHIFNSIQGVKRATYGEVLFALSIGLSAVLIRDNAIYTIALLHLALADGLAAIVGIGMAKRAKNFIFNGCRKSIAGSTTFLLVSLGLNLFYWFVIFGYDFPNFNLALSPGLYSLLSAITLTLTEIISPNGSDNFTIPIVSGLLLWLPQIIL